MSERPKDRRQDACKFGFPHCFCRYGDQPNHRKTTTDPWIGKKPKKPQPEYVPPALPKDVRYVDTQTTFELDVQTVAKTLTDLLIRKHKDYGPLNVANAPGGALNGLRVRIHDKTARINHLIESGADPQNESLQDSFKDLANYAIIALLVLDNRWPSN